MVPQVDRPLRDLRVAVTGASGFVGRALVRTLLARGAQVIAVVRDLRKAPFLEQRGVALRRADLRDRASLAAAFQGADALIANAALVSFGLHSERALIDTNVGGTRNQLRAAREAGVERVLFTSSAAAYRPRRDAFYREDDPLRQRHDRVGRVDYYALSKACAEREAWALAEALDLQLTTVRPHQIHGPFDRGSFTHWMRRLLSPPVSVFPTHVSLPSVYVGDLAEAMCRALEREVAVGKAYNVAAEPDSVTFWKLMRAYVAAGGEAPRWVLPLPVPVRRRYDITRAKRELGFANRALVEGFRETLALEQQAARV